MGRIFKKAMPKGFTLVELLIVVAIIGVLSSIGVPTFRRMVTKSKKTEARVALGGLFTAESAFFSEYNTYGTRLTKIGFDIGGAQRNYTIGFPNVAGTAAGGAAAACVDGDVLPVLNVGLGIPLNKAFPAYYQPVVANGPETGQNGQTVIGRTTVAALGDAQCGAGAQLIEGTSKYRAVATGNIAPGVAVTKITGNGCTVNCQDVWTIDEARNLVNKVDGTN